MLIRLGQDLDQHRNSPAVDIGIIVDFQQDLAGYSMYSQNFYLPT
jgi:hypothetical protein